MIPIAKASMPRRLLSQPDRFGSLESRRLQHLFRGRSPAALVRLQEAFPASRGRCSCRWRRKQRGPDRGGIVRGPGDVFGAWAAAAVLADDSLGKGMFWWLDKLGVLSASGSSWVGRKLRGRGDPIFGYELKQAVKCGKVVLKTRALGAGASGMRFGDGTALKVRNIVWATGFAGGYDWLHIEQALDRKKAPIHTRGISPVKGLYYVGLPWQTHRGSALLAGVSRDAREIVQAIMEKRDKFMEKNTMSCCTKTRPWKRHDC